MMVVDASVVADVLLRVSDASRLEARLFRRDEVLHAPALLDVEVTHVMRRFVLRRELPVMHGDAAVRILERFPIRRHPHTPLLSRVWQLRDIASAYDAAYIALAEALGAPLITRDAALAKTRGHTARIELL